jgi:hypothetical protein
MISSAAPSGTWMAATRWHALRLLFEAHIIAELWL